ncbi:MAG TPA: hypothetical protein VHV30_01690 [Polyangiaceae bacterium]|jgi:hypothetical protein|nr:hypothetical protein [Polyangiaceae bacterium]
MRPPASSRADAGEGVSAKVEAASKRTPVVVAASMIGIVVFVVAATWVVCTVRARDVPGATLGGGKPTLDDPNDCRTALATTTTCRGENSGFQECHYHFRAEGLPDPEICTAFLAGPDAVPPAHPAAARPVDGGARAACPENDPTGWQRVACADYHVEAAMVCFECLDGSRPESAREIVQAFDRTCERGIVLKSCNEPLRSTAGL